jgi:hypothetical protein
MYIDVAKKKMSVYVQVSMGKWRYMIIANR